MDATFLVAVSIFLLFISFILVSTINYFTRTPESASIIELRAKTKDLFDTFFGSGGIVTNERATIDLYRIPLLLTENNGTARTNEVVSLGVEFDYACDKKMSWNNTIRVYDQQFNELPSKISYQEFCSSQWLNTSSVTFFVNMSANEKKRVYVYSVNNSNTTSPRHNITIQGYWKLDEAGGTLAKDSSGYQNNGTLRNFNLNGSSGWFNGTDCVYGSCVKLDGADDNVTVTTFDVGPGNVSVTFWVKTTDSNSIIMSQGASSASGFYITIEPDSDVRVHLESSASNYEEFTITNPSLNNGDWHHFAFVKNTTDVSEVYIDGLLKSGTLIETGTFTGNIQNLNNPLLFGDYLDAGYEFNGTIDDIRIYNKSLTVSELTSISNATLLTVTSFPAENITAISATRLQELTGRNYQAIKSLLGGDFDFRVEVREKR